MSDRRLPRTFLERFSLFRRTRTRIRLFLWPIYECELCVGQEPWRGCYCAYYGAVAPNDVGPEWWRVQLRRAYMWVFCRGVDYRG